MVRRAGKEKRQRRKRIRCCVATTAPRVNRTRWGTLNQFTLHYTKLGDDMMKFDIPGRLPGLNEIIDAAKKGKRGYQPYAIMKEQYTSKIALIAKMLPQFQRVNITITWYEPNIKRDPDNIMAGQKFILDSLVKAGVIHDDSQKYINSIIHKFEVDRQNPKVEVEVEEI
jgi:Holliday junction resolvase RusA-like endonuclease